MIANNTNPSLGPYCLQYRLPKNIGRLEKQTLKVITDRLNVNLLSTSFKSVPLRVIYCIMKHVNQIMHLQDMHSKFFLHKSS